MKIKKVAGFSLKVVRTIDKDFLKLEEQTNRLIKKYERRMHLGYRDALNELRKEIALLYEKYSDSDGKLTLEQMNKYDRISKLEKAIAATLTTLYLANRRQINSALREIYGYNTNGAINAVKRVTDTLPAVRLNFEGIVKKLDVAKVINEEMAGLNWATRMNKHRADVIYNVERTVREGLYQGDTYKTMSKRLKDSLEGDVVNPARIVRTESGRVMQQAHKDIMDEVAKEATVTKKWLTSRDERVRSSHNSLSNTVILYDDLFTFPSGNTTFAPKLSGIASEDINCRCVLSYDIR